jgi:hypothetical protein
MIDRKAFERMEIANAQLPEASAIALDTFKDPLAYHSHGLQVKLCVVAVSLLIRNGSGSTHKELARIRRIEALTASPWRS